MVAVDRVELRLPDCGMKNELEAGNEQKEMSGGRVRTHRHAVTERHIERERQKDTKRERVREREREAQRRNTKTQAKISTLA